MSEQNKSPEAQVAARMDAAKTKEDVIDSINFLDLMTQSAKDRDEQMNFMRTVSALEKKGTGVDIEILKDGSIVFEMPVGGVEIQARDAETGETTTSEPYPEGLEEYARCPVQQTNCSDH
ncbi:MAG: hypothetical protein IPK73_10000 [Candidatus Obscuribacter sp.]|nr:hypothetical protein [Candidatus Obscuribacter sp.]